MISDLTRGRLAIKYILIETLPSFVVGVIIFLFILLMFQVLRLTEFVLVHGVSLGTVIQLMTYMSISFLPVILPMSLLFSVLITYGRLSSDSEIIAFKSLGLNMKHLALPALIIGAGVTLLSLHTSFFLAPWGNRQFELKTHELSRVKAGAIIREGVFSEGFFDMVIYANNVDSRAGMLQKVFIYDERDPKAPMTIIAREGQIVQKRDPVLGDTAQLNLLNGSIHSTNKDTYTKIDFGKFTIYFNDPVEASEKRKSPQSMTLPELEKAKLAPDLEPKKLAGLNVEIQRRVSLSFACLLFALIGVGLGTQTNRRMARAGGMVICLVVIVAYWAMYVGAEGLARNQILPAAVSLWSVNVIFSGFAWWAMKRASKS